MCSTRWRILIPATSIRVEEFWSSQPIGGHDLAIPILSNRERLSILSYLPTDAEEPCPCGSGNSFGACCYPLLYWQPICRGCPITALEGLGKNIYIDELGLTND